MRFQHAVAKEHRRAAPRLRPPRVRKCPVESVMPSPWVMRPARSGVREPRMTLLPDSAKSRASRTAMRPVPNMPIVVFMFFVRS